MNKIARRKTISIATLADMSNNKALQTIKAQTMFVIMLMSLLFMGQASAQIALPLPPVDGVLDTGFFPPAGSTVSAIAVRDDRRVIIGGFFTTSGGLNRNRLAVINPDGSLDTEFPNISVNNGGVLDILIQSDGSFIIAGSFTTITVPDGTANGNTVTRNRIARFSADGVLDAGYSPNVSGQINVLASQTIDGEEHVLIGGSFTNFNGRNRIARLQPNGDVDSRFTASANNQVQSIAVTPDNQVLIGGTFGSISNIGTPGSTARDNIARLDVDGTVDTSFNAGNININGANGSVNGILVQADGQIVILGAFTSVGGVSRLQFARLNPNGSVEAGYNEGGFDANGTDIGGLEGLSDGLLQADGKLIIVGSVNVDFEDGGNIVPNIIRVNTDGTYDPTFTAVSTNPVSTVAIQPFDNAILVGSFPSTVAGGGVDGLPHSGVARFGNSVLPVFNFTATPENLQQTVIESNLATPNAGNSFSFEVTRTVNTTSVAVVSFEIVGSGDNPTDDDDFSSSLGTTVVFEPDVVRQTIDVVVAGDTRTEQDETFTISLVDVQNAVLGTPITAQGTIEEEQPPLCLPIEASNGNFAVICI